jgi:diaminobutyrate-2-oxoglutarate transaminase
MIRASAARLRVISSEDMLVNVFERLESNVRSYSRSFPTIFDRAVGAFLYDTSGRRYIDFFCGAGTLNYGHNEPGMKRALLDYLEADGVIHGLDMSTRAKAEFMERFDAIVLAPRGLAYKLQFTGPTGANAVEAALKLARKVTGRANVVAFTNAYHGLSLGALAVTANSSYRTEAFVNRTNVAFVPYDGYLGPSLNTMELFERLLADASSGLDRPAAVLVETIQAEGGINVASTEWLRQLEKLCRQFDVLLIVDDIQVGCGRTGTFFSFETAGICPDMVVLSKAISGFGLPMSLLLIRPELDQWTPGEHTGTFRGNNAAFVTASAALRFWETPALAQRVSAAGATLASGLAVLARQYPDLSVRIRGRGLIYGFETALPEVNERIARECFDRGLIVELCGGTRKVVKLLPALNVDDDVIAEAVAVLASSVEVAARGARASVG